MRAKALTPERIERLKIKNSSPASIAHFKGLRAKPEIQAKRLERIHAIRSHRVSVLDSQTNETSVYPSIREAAKGIGVSKSSISQAFIRLSEGDSVRIKKKRYQITKLQD